MKTIRPNKQLLSHIDLGTQQYWIFQLAGWCAMAILTYLSLNIWYTPGEWAPVVHSILQSIAGMIISLPLRYIVIASWNKSALSRLLFNGTAVLIAAIIWTVWRVNSFTWLTGEVIELADWGGWINASVIVFTAWLFCYYALRYYRESLEKERQAAEAQRAVLEAQANEERANFKRVEAEKHFHETQMRLLKNQLNPHFFLNALNSVSALIVRNDKTAALEMLARIGDFLRTSLANPEELHHTLEEELAALDLYLGIEKIRFGERLQTRFDIDPEALKATVPSLILQPLFENAIKHAVSKSQKPTLIEFNARIEDGSLLLELSDDGPGSTGRPDLQTFQEGSQIGLKNVQKRLQSAFSDKFSLEFGPGKDTGFDVRISIFDQAKTTKTV